LRLGQRESSDRPADGKPVRNRHSFQCVRQRAVDMDLRRIEWRDVSELRHNGCSNSCGFACVRIQPRNML
jgi:hypothetical protein